MLAAACHMAPDMGGYRWIANGRDQAKLPRRSSAPTCLPKQGSPGADGGDEELAG